MRLLLDTNVSDTVLEVSGVVVTENIRHLSRFVESLRWQDVAIDAP
jgi:hypothetical protein